MTESEKLSYLVPRDPSIKSWNDRVKLPAPLTHNMVKLGIDAIEGSENENLKVYLRIKPCYVEWNPYSVTNNTLETEATNDKKNSKNERKFIHRFHFTSIFNQNASQASVFQKCVVENLKKFINGRSDLLFAYGTTNSGKTYTMQGTVEKPGLIPRSIQFVFNCLKDNIDAECECQPYRYDELYPLNGEELMKIAAYKNFILNLDLSKYRYTDLISRNFRTDSTKSSSVFSENYENVTFREMENNLEDVEYKVGDCRYSLWISMIEIYNEQIYDLLRIPNENESRLKLGFAEDENGKVYIRDLCYINVKSGHEAFQVFQFGKANLRFGPTALNNHSSRSHCIFTLTLARFVGNRNSDRSILSRFSFCDLAGLERVKKTLTDGHRLAESKCINVSLSIFVKCLRIIKENQTSVTKKLVPYRESKLTRLFRDEMIGKGSFAIIVNITPEVHLSNETLNVLKFSTIAQRIIPVNVFPKSKKVQRNRKSKFAALVAKANDNSLIDWESMKVLDLEKEEQCSHAYSNLLGLVDSLKDELERERERANNIEKKIREEVVMKVSKIIEEHDEANWNMLETETQRIQEMYEKKEKRLMKYFAIEKEKVKKRRREDSTDFIDLEKQIETLKMEMDCLKSENTSLIELIQQMNGDQNNLQSRCTQLELELCEKDRLLKLSEKDREGYDGEGDKYTKELEAQLADSKSKISELKNLLRESAFEYRDMLETNKLLREEIECLTHDVETKSSVLEDLKNELHENKAIISAKSIKIEELESQLEKASDYFVGREGRIKQSPELDGLPEQLEKCGKSKTTRTYEKLRNKTKDSVNSLTKSRGVNEKLRNNLENEKNIEDAVLIKLDEANKENVELGLKSDSDSFKNCIKSLSPMSKVLSDNTSPNVDSEKDEICTPERLNRQIEKLSILNTDSKKSKKLIKVMDDSIHPSLIKSCSRSRRRGRKDKEVNSGDKCRNEEDVKEIEDKVDGKEPGIRRKGKKCTKKLFIENDFDGIIDLETSFIEPEIPGLRLRKN